MNRRLPSSLQTRILLLIGSAVIVLMIVLSFLMLYNWQKIMLTSEQDNALAYTRAFSIAVRDAMIQKENNLLPTEGYLDNYVANFMRSDSRIRYVAIYDSKLEMLALAGGSGTLNTIPSALLAQDDPSTMIQHHDQLGWVIETVYPILTAKKRWGTVVLAIEADSIRDRMRQGFLYLVVLTVVVTMILLLLLHALISRVLRSLHEFVQKMDETTIITSPSETQVQATDEIGLLYEHFHSLQVRLNQSQESLNLAQQQVFHAERLASIGRLAAGIAHEINNPINGIKSCLYAIDQDPQNEANLREYLQLIDEGLAHVSGVVQKLLNFGRRHQVSTEPVILNDQIQNVAGLLSYSLREKEITLELNLADSLPPIHASGQLMQEVYINLIMNSIDAVESGGKIIVTTESTDDGLILSRVTDFGRGIPQEQIQQIFDPFYTTKEIGKGTGLGLSVSLGIIHSFNGTIEVESEENVQTTFTLTLPVMDDDENTPD